MKEKVNLKTEVVKKGSGGSAISIEAVYKTYEEHSDSDDGRYVLRDINLAVAPNEFVCVLGPSGCGKSTLLNLIAGYIKPNKGTIKVYDEVVSGASDRTGVVFQDHALLPWLTVKKNVALGPKLSHKSKSEIETITKKYIKMVGLEGIENAFPKALSGGMAQRVGIARALANEPKVLLMDEPLGALDALTRENMRQEILKIWQETNTTIFFITHSVQEAVYLADRVVLLKEGVVDCDIRIEVERPRGIKDPKFANYVSFFENKLSDGRLVTND